MNRDEFENLKIGDYVQVTSHGQNRGKIGRVIKTNYRSAYLKGENHYVN